MNIEEMEFLSKESLLLIKGGRWYYDKKADEWYWIETNSLEPDSPEEM